MGILLLSGTTASGKSSLALQLAEQYEAAIVSADAMTVYRGLDIGTAKPTHEEQRRVPYLGIDVRNIDEEFDVSSFVDLVDQATSKHRHTIICGGTTFWLSALVRPLADLPASDPAVRAKLEALEDPYGALAAIDPLTAERLHPNDRVRVIRALEVHRITGKTQSQLHDQGPRRDAIDAEVVFLDRDDNADRIERRLAGMLEQGYVEEVKNLLDAGWVPTVKPLKSFAYRHLVEHCVDALPLDEAIRRTARDTRYYAKKQRNWARNLQWSTTSEADAFEAAKRAFK